MTDPVDQYLGTDFGIPASPKLQQAVLRETTRLLRRRRRRRRLAWAGAMAACFLAGMVTMGLWRTSAEMQQTKVSPAPPKASEKPESPPAPAEPSLTDLEWRAFDSRQNRTALFFQVGDRYFEEQHDMDAALRCYRQALDAAPPEELAVRPDDNWLVMALKEARQKEKDDALINP